MQSNLTTQELNARIAKLPKWAQEELRLLRRERDEALDSLEDMRAGTYGDADTDTVANPYSEAPLLLHKGETVSYRLGYGNQDAVRVRLDGYGALLVNGDRAIHIRPEASNSVRVELATD